jgi:tetratricopeptide (TPR) repeat protein
VKPQQRSAVTQAAAIFAAALLVRALYLASIWKAYFFAHPQTEPLRYHRWASAILEGLAKFSPPFDEAPGYVYFVAAIYRLFGQRPAAVAVAQAVLGALACVALAAAARRLSGPRAGLIAGGLAALYGPLIYCTGEMVPSTLMMLAVAVALAATPMGEGAPAGNWWAAGATWGTALLVRSEALAAIPVLLLHAGLSGGRRAVFRAALVPAALLATSLAVNHAASDRWVLLTSGAGVNLWIGNNPHADGVNPFIHGPLIPAVAEVRAASRDQVEADDAFLRRALSSIRAEPGRALRLLLRKLAWTFSDRELPNTADIDWQTAQSWLFHPPWFPLRFGYLLSLAAAGAVLFGRRWRTALILAAPIAIGIATCALFFTNARFRLVLVAAIIPLAAIAVEELIAALAQRRKPALLVLPSLTAALAVALAWADLDGLRAYRIPQLDVNTAAQERAMGDVPSAIRHLELAVRGDPTDAATWVQLGVSLEQAGRLREAAGTWNRALAQLPNDGGVRRMVARFRRLHRGVEP